MQIQHEIIIMYISAGVSNHLILKSWDILPRNPGKQRVQKSGGVT